VSTTSAGTEPELWLQPPPGWLELTAFAGEDAAVAWLDHWLAPDRDRIDAGLREQLATTLRRAYAATADSPLVSSGVVITALSDTTATMWHYGVATVRASLTDIEPVALAERIIGAGLAGAVDETEEFTNADGQPGIAVYTRTTARGGDLAANIPAADPENLGVCYALVPVLHAPGWLAVVTGVAPNLDERRAMAVGVAMIAGTVQARPAGDPGPAPDRVILDAAGGGRVTTGGDDG
jgi:hypothetical protein